MQKILAVIISFVQLVYFVNVNFRDQIRSKPVRSLRSSEKSNVHHVSFLVDEETIAIFEPILRELDMRLQGEGSGSMFPHSIANPSVNSKAVMFEATSLLSDRMQHQLNEWITSRDNSDGITRKCFRALANYYETTKPLSSKCSDPLMLPHRDDVGSADVSVVLGITPRNEYRGAMLYISTERSSGKLWTEHGKPSRKKSDGIDVHRGVCVILKHKVEHYVSALQSGSWGSIVFHMTSV